MLIVLCIMAGGFAFLVERMIIDLSVDRRWGKES